MVANSSAHTLARSLSGAKPFVGLDVPPSMGFMPHSEGRGLAKNACNLPLPHNANVVLTCFPSQQPGKASCVICFTGYLSQVSSLELARRDIYSRNTLWLWATCIYFTLQTL